MSFYDDASLVVIPSGYKTSKVYAEKPTDGSGDLAFTRTGDTATRVGPDGLIEKVRTNLILQSQTFDNASWAKLQIGGASVPVVTANNTTAPDGTLTADKVVFVAPTSGDTSQLDQVISLTGVANGSVYLKAFAAGDVGKILAVRFNSAGYALATLTADWQRFSVSQTAVVGSFEISLRPAVGSSSGTVSVSVWGAQLETGDVATDYIPTTTAAVSVGPVANVPRLDYLGSSCPRLLLEGQRQNLVTFSESFDNAAWTKNVATITANASVSPDGYTNADTLTESTFTSDSAFIYETLVVTPSTPYTTSVFVKQGAGRYVYLRNYYNAGNAYHTVVADTQTGTITQASVGSGVINASSSIEAYGNGWYRVRATQTSTVEIALLPIIGLSATATPTVGTFGQITIASNAGRSASVWGGQVEAGAYATSYIPTLASASTRSADAASKTGISSLIGQTEGSAFVECTVDTTNSNGAMVIYLGSSDGGGAFDYSTYLKFSGTSINLAVYSGGNLFVDSTSAQTYTNNSLLKVAFAYKNNDFVCYANGVQLFTDTSGTVSSNLSSVTFGAYPLNIPFNQYNGKISQALLFKTRLTNAEMAELTTI